MLISSNMHVAILFLNVYYGVAMIELCLWSKKICNSMGFRDANRLRVDKVQTIGCFFLCCLCRDICDCKIASMRAHIKRWVNEKHDVLTAEDMKQAVESHRGLTGIRATVVEVDLNGPDVKEADQLNKATVNEWMKIKPRQKIAKGKEAGKTTFSDASVQVDLHTTADTDYQFRG